jgi:hypothetical protein
MKEIYVYLYGKLQAFILYKSRSISLKFFYVELTHFNKSIKKIRPVDIVVPHAVNLPIQIISVEFSMCLTNLYSRPSCDRAPL